MVVNGPPLALVNEKPAQVLPKRLKGSKVPLLYYTYTYKRCVCISIHIHAPTLPHPLPESVNVHLHCLTVLPLECLLVSIDLIAAIQTH